MKKWMDLLNTLGVPYVKIFTNTLKDKLGKYMLQI
jgi:hypothetical protein